mgnify:CR=1 FL=1
MKSRRAIYLILHLHQNRSILLLILKDTHEIYHTVNPKNL